MDTDTITSVLEESSRAALMQQAGAAAILMGVAIFIFFYALYAPKTPLRNRNTSGNSSQGVDEEDGSSFSRYIRPMLRNFIPQTPLAAQSDSKNLDKTRELLIKSGNPWKLRPEELLGTQALFAALGAALGLVLFILNVIPIIPPVAFIFIMPIAGWFIPYSFHNSRKIARGDEIQKQLPEAIDLLVITLASGKTFEPALAEVAPSLPDGLLKEEFTKVNGELNAGRSLSEVMIDFAHRSASEDAETFAKAIVQSQKLGSEPSETLQSQATAARESYEARVERKIAKLSSIMMIPLVFTMIPALIIIILAPTMISLMGSLG